MTCPPGFGRFQSLVKWVPYSKELICGFSWLSILSACFGPPEFGQMCDLGRDGGLLLQNGHQYGTLPTSITHSCPNNWTGEQPQTCPQKSPELDFHVFQIRGIWDFLTMVTWLLSRHWDRPERWRSRHRCSVTVALRWILKSKLPPHFPRFWYRGLCIPEPSWVRFCLAPYCGMQCHCSFRLQRICVEMLSRTTETWSASWAWRAWSPLARQPGQTSYPPSDDVSIVGVHNR